ncbi:MAG: response regulator [Gammaproteobacteria bacterium]|nr:response regulator [Gammaproteobacteria bacterium]
MGDQHKILIIDDEISVHRTLEALLVAKGYDLYFSASGLEGLKKAVDILPDIVLLDIMMPGMDGFEVCRRMREDDILSEIPIVMITALDDRESKLSGIRNGADEFITKPFDSHELRLRIQTILRLDRYRNLLTQRKEKEILERRLLQDDRLKAIGAVASGITHDFKNILFPIQSYTQMALGSLPKDSVAYKDLQNVLKAVERAKNLSDRILTFSKEGPSEKIPLELDLVVKEVLQLIRASTPQFITLNEAIDENIGKVLADPVQIHRLLMNLCLNAIHAMKEKEGVLTVSLTREKAHVKLMVEDTGHGMDEDTMEKIFDPYFSTKPVGEGTGLGLSTAHGIIKSYKGQIYVRSVLGSGTVFEIFLPVLKALPTVQEEKNDKNKYGGSERILLVDDDDSSLKLISDVLIRKGYGVTVKRNGPEAWATFHSTPDQFELIVTDKSMPQMSGVQLSQKIRETRANIPIIMISSLTDPGTRKIVKQIGMNKLFGKPVSLSRLGRVVRQVLDESVKNRLMKTI